MDAPPRKRRWLRQCACRRFASLLLPGASLFFLVRGGRQSSGAMALRERPSMPSLPGLTRQSMRSVGWLRLAARFLSRCT